MDNMKHLSILRILMNCLKCERSYKMPMNFHSKDFDRFTADDEEPNCIRCFNQDTCGDGKKCGPKHGWCLYERYEPKQNNNKRKGE